MNQESVRFEKRMEAKGDAGGGAGAAAPAAPGGGAQGAADDGAAVAVRRVAAPPGVLAAARFAGGHLIHAARGNDDGEESWTASSRYYTNSDATRTITTEGTRSVQGDNSSLNMHNPAAQGAAPPGPPAAAGGPAGGREDDFNFDNVDLSAHVFKNEEVERAFAEMTFGQGAREGLTPQHLMQFYSALGEEMSSQEAVWLIQQLTQDPEKRVADFKDFYRLKEPLPASDHGTWTTTDSSQSSPSCGQHGRQPAEEGEEGDMRRRSVPQSDPPQE
eukprot:TRINITY_DN67298_c0_g1_i1.p1 TRINITY_DN67298_c0_g1~~TRINITY_DN67298_c0_g1_i1.p1  ORF type:complete len:274 (+),score=64.90 TRINITY_DN67298_c0_g1_i1:80-901(+)